MLVVMNTQEYYDRKKARNQLLLAEFQTTSDLDRTAQKFGMSTQATRTALKLVGVQFSKRSLRKKSACHQNKDKVIQMALEGKSLAEIGRTVGTSGRHVHRFLKEHGHDRKFPTARPGKDHPLWKGGRYQRKDGYIQVSCPNHPNASKYTGKVYEHRLVMENHIGRYLEQDEAVHHKNSIRWDNRIENLELFYTNGEHLSKELAGHSPNWTIDGIHRMQEAAVRRAKTPRTRIHRDLKRDVFESL